MHQYLHLFPYKKQILQLQTDAKKVFDQTVSQRIEDNPDFLDFFFHFFSDEENLLLSGLVKKTEYAHSGLTLGFMIIGIAHLVWKSDGLVRVRS